MSSCGGILLHGGEGSEILRTVWVVVHAVVNLCNVRRRALGAVV